MADESLLKDLYGRMTNQSLIDRLFTKNEELTYDALEILKQEIASRNINLQQLELENRLKEQREKEYETFKEQKGEKQMLLIINNIINDKKDGKTNTEIAAAFQQQGVKNDIAIMLIADAKEKCVSITDTMWSNLFWGGMIVTGGVIMMYLAKHFSYGTIFYLPYGLLIYGIIKLVNGLVQLPARKVLNEIAQNF